MGISARYHHPQALRKIAALRKETRQLLHRSLRKVDEFLTGHSFRVHREDSEQIARSFRVLSDPSCLRLLEFLAAAERTSAECAAYLSTPKNRIQPYLSRLQSSGWIAGHRRGRFRFYRLADPRAAELMLLARAMAAENSGALAECTQLDQQPQ